MENVLDIFIIGGGINGVGIAADAAGRGLSVALCEKNDLASATSSASSKLIHGGLRYLEQYDFNLVRKALKEREILLHNAPHLICPLEFILPHAKHLRPAWLIRIGLFIYDHLASHPLLPNSKKINLRKNSRGDALLPEFTTGFSYFDCHTDDARLVVLNAIAAKENGASILTHVECISATREQDKWRIELKNKDNNKLTTYYAKVLINAAGPWITEVQKKFVVAEKDLIPTLSINLIKGSHIVVPKLFPGDYAYILQNPDDRVVFVIPYQKDYTLIGTTDIPFSGDLSEIKKSPEEVTYLCDTVNQYFKKNITAQDIIWSYAGVRCLQTDDANKPSEITRDYKFLLQEKLQLLTIVSGKLTTYRKLAEEVLDNLRPYFPNMKATWTANKPLPGGDFSENNFAGFSQALKKEYPWLPESLATRYAHSYGTRAYIFLQETSSLSDLGISFAAGLYQKEIEYLIQHEWALTAEDILWRRSKLGLFFSHSDVEKLEQWLAENR